MSDKAPLSALERHVSYFDSDGDGQITMAQTYKGLRGVGVGVLTALGLTLLINGFLGYLTHGKLSLKVSVRDIARGKHPYDTGSFDTRGGRDPLAFEQLFSAPGTIAPFDRLTAGEIRTVIVARGDPKKPFGESGSALSNWFSSKEIQLLLCVASDCKKCVHGEQQPAISRRTLNRFYSGHLLFLLARQRRIVQARAR